MLRLLLIEDNVPDIELFKITLRHLKLSNQVNVTEVLDGELALEMMRKMHPRELPDVVLLDLKLPKLDGKEILKEMKEDENLKHIPVIIFSSSDAYDDIQESYRRGASCYVKKASDFQQMQNKIRSMTDFWFNSVSYPHSH